MRKRSTTPGPSGARTYSDDQRERLFSDAVVFLSQLALASVRPDWKCLGILEQHGMMPAGSQSFPASRPSPSPESWIVSSERGTRTAKRILPIAKVFEGFG
jgi:hypothetical protein